MWLSSWILRARARSARYGEMKAVRVVVHDEATSLATCESACVSASWVTPCEGNRLARGEATRPPGQRASPTTTDLSNAADVLLAVLGREAEVLVEAEADVVAVEAERALALLEELELERARERRLARGCAWIRRGSASRRQDEGAPLAARRNRQLQPQRNRERPTHPRDQ